MIKLDFKLSEFLKASTRLSVFFEDFSTTIPTGIFFESSDIAYPIKKSKINGKTKAISIELGSRIIW